MAVLAVSVLCALPLASGSAAADNASRTACPNQSSPGFRSYLPDCRAYEMVTPPFKGGFPTFVVGISESGSQLFLLSLGAFSHVIDTGEFGGNYQAGRTQEGWALAPFSVPPSVFPGFRVETVSPDLASSLWFAQPSSQSVIQNIYLSASPHGPFLQVGPSGPSSFGERTLNLSGVSRDLSHSFYTVLAPNVGRRSPLWPGDRTAALGQPSLYEYAGTDNVEPRLVGVSDVGPVASIATSNLISECGTYLGGLVSHRASAYNAVSTDGGTAFFTALGYDYGICAAEGGECKEDRVSGPVSEPCVNELYARLDGSQADAHTVSISEPSKVDCSECSLLERADAEFRGASADGSKVFFTTEQHLLSGPSEAGSDLYEYNFRDPEGKRVMRMSAGDPAGARERKVLCVANDGSHVYFVAQGVLTAIANASGQHAEENAENIYVYERSGTYPSGHVAFIGIGGVGAAQATPDGRFLVFESAADLTPDEGGRLEAGQVFEYDAETGIITRVSHGEAGYNEDGNSSVYAAAIPNQFSSSVPIIKSNGVALSADGAYVFFTSKDALTSQTQDGVMNVYEYHEGHVALISDGHDLVNVNEGPAVALLGTDASGMDVYFETADQLVGQDADTQLDVYDARIEGGFPAVPASPECSGDTCQGPFVAGLSPPAPPTFSSTGESPISLVPGLPSKAKSKKPTHRRSKKRHRKMHSRKAVRAAGGGR